MNDVEEIDKGFTDFIKYLKHSDEQYFEENYSEHYIVNLSNKQVSELIPQGAKKKVDFKDKEKYI